MPPFASTAWQPITTLLQRGITVKDAASWISVVLMPLCAKSSANCCPIREGNVSQTITLMFRLDPSAEFALRRNAPTAWDCE